MPAPVKVALVRSRAAPGHIPLFRQPLEQRCQRAGIQIQVLPDLLDAQLPVLPQHHHGDVLRVGQVELVKKRLVCLDDLLRVGIQREADLIFELYRD